MERRLKQTSRFASSVRALLALGLLLLLISGSVPLGSASGEPKCELECCSALASHAAGSCGEGSCHAGVLSKVHVHGRGGSQSESARAESTNVEPLCGLSTHLGANNLARMRQAANERSLSSLPSKSSSRSSSQAQKNSLAESAAGYSPSSDARAQVSVAVMSKPCNPECGSGAVSSSSSKRKAVAAGDAHQQSTNGSGLFNATYRQHQTLDSLCGRCSPRGPPLPS